MGIFDEPLSKAKHEALWEFIRGCSPPVYRADDQHQVPIGTGTLLAIAGRSFLATAAHVAKLGDGGRLALPVDRSFRLVTTIGRSSVIRGALDQHDVSIASIEDDHVVAMLRKHWRFLPLDCLGTPWHRGPFLIYGFLQPDQIARGPNLPGRPVGIITGKYDGLPQGTADPFDEQHDMLLEWPPNPITIDGEPVTPPRLHGVSGASGWAFEPEQGRRKCVWTPDTQLKLVGIQIGAKQGEYIRGKRWHLLWSAIAEVDSKSADAVRAAIERHQAQHARPEKTTEGKKTRGPKKKPLRPRPTHD